MIGHLRHRVRIEEADLTADEGGGQSLAWSLLADAWARIETVSGREVVRAGQLAPRVLYKVSLRHRTDVEAGQRLVVDGETLLIEAAYDPDGRRRLLVCDCVLVDGGTL